MYKTMWNLFAIADPNRVFTAYLAEEEHSLSGWAAFYMQKHCIHEEHCGANVNLLRATRKLIFVCCRHSIGSEANKLCCLHCVYVLSAPEGNLRKGYVVVVASTGRVVSWWWHQLEGLCRGGGINWKKQVVSALLSSSIAVEPHCMKNTLL